MRADDDNSGLTVNTQRSLSTIRSSMADTPNKLKARLPRGWPTAGRPRSPRRGTWSRRSAGVRALRLRAGGDAGHRIHRRARQVPARPGPPERGRVLVPGRRRAVAVAALRPDGAAGALRGGEITRTSRCPIAPTATATSSATRSRGRGAIGNSCSSTPTRSARRAWPPMPRCACWRRTRWRRSASSAAICGEGEKPKVLDGVMEATGLAATKILEALNGSTSHRQVDRLGFKGEPRF